jgi:hypothetical protein
MASRVYRIDARRGNRWYSEPAMKLKLDYETDGLLADFPDNATVIEPLYVPPVEDAFATLAAAVRSPIGARLLRELVKPGTVTRHGNDDRRKDSRKEIR